MPRIYAMYYAPVKALALAPLERARLGKAGIPGDRAFFIMDERGRLFTQRAAVEYLRTRVLPLRERTVALAHEQYNVMLLGTYQLIAAKQREIDAWRDYIETVRDYWIARSDLERALGAPIPQGDQK